MVDRFLVTVDFEPLISLGPSEIEFNGQVFDCNRCAVGGICCNTNPTCQPVCAQCLKCSCQKKGITQCNSAAICNGICDGFKIGGTGCACNVQNTNNLIFGPRQTKDMTCPEAAILLNNPDQEAKVRNADAVRTQCDPNSRLDCCKGDANLGSARCGVFFGPTNFLGNCDSIMQSFCTTNPTDPLCACLKSDLPVPECTDKRCRNTNAMKLSNQFFNLGPDAKNNLVNNNVISQSCNSDQINPTGASVAVQGSPESSLGIAAIIGIVFGIVVGVVIIVVLAVLASEGKLSKKIKKSISKKRSSIKKKANAKKKRSTSNPK